jgi:hypothetical protein
MRTRHSDGTRVDAETKQIKPLEFPRVKMQHLEFKDITSRRPVHGICLYLRFLPRFSIGIVSVERFFAQHSVIAAWQCIRVCFVFVVKLDFDDEPNRTVGENGVVDVVQRTNGDVDFALTHIPLGSR